MPKEQISRASESPRVDGEPAPNHIQVHWLRDSAMVQVATISPGSPFVWDGIEKQSSLHLCQTFTEPAIMWTDQKNPPPCGYNADEHEWDDDAGGWHHTYSVMGGPFDGWYVDLDRGAINRLIMTLRRARDAAFGKDA